MSYFEYQFISNPTTMDNAATKKATEKWIKIYSRQSDEHLLEVYNEDFHEQGTPRRPEDKGRLKALIALIGDKINGGNKE